MKSAPLWVIGPPDSPTRTAWDTSGDVAANADPRSPGLGCGKRDSEQFERFTEYMARHFAARPVVVSAGKTSRELQ